MIVISKEDVFQFYKILNIYNIVNKNYYELSLEEKYNVEEALMLFLTNILEVT
jgi:hypothetical protein